jgi:hypothetical protein
VRTWAGRRPDHCNFPVVYVLKNTSTDLGYGLGRLTIGWRRAFKLFTKRLIRGFTARLAPRGLGPWGSEGRCPLKGPLRREAEEVQDCCAGGTRSLWHFLVRWLVFWASQSMEDALCWIASRCFLLGIVWVLVLPGLRRIFSGFGNQKRRLSPF